MLSKRATDVLRIMHETDEEIVVEGIQVWVGEEQTSRSVWNALLECLSIKDVSDTKGLQRFVINETGRAILRRPELVDEIHEAIENSTPFTLQGDRVVLLVDGMIPSGR